MQELNRDINYQFLCTEYFTVVGCKCIELLNKYFVTEASQQKSLGKLNFISFYE